MDQDIPQDYPNELDDRADWYVPMAAYVSKGLQKLQFQKQPNKKSRYYSPYIDAYRLFGSQTLCQFRTDSERLNTFNFKTKTESPETIAVSGLLLVRVARLELTTP